MKSLAIAVFSFLAGLFAPELSNLSKSNLSFPNIQIGSIDPLIIAMAALVLWAISKARAKRKGGKS